VTLVKPSPISEAADASEEENHETAPHDRGKGGRALAVREDVKAALEKAA
jgi:hypothetical protein